MIRAARKRLHARGYLARYQGQRDKRSHVRFEQVLSGCKEYPRWAGKERGEIRGRNTRERNKSGGGNDDYTTTPAAVATTTTTVVAAMETAAESKERGEEDE